MTSGGLGFSSDGLNTGNAGGSGGPTIKTLTVEAEANTYYQLEDLGEVAEGDSWQIVGYFSAAELSGSLVRGQLVRVLGTVSRNVGSNSLTIDTTLSNSGGTLPGFSSGVRLTNSGTNLVFEGRVTNANTIKNAWWYTLTKIPTA